MGLGLQWIVDRITFPSPPSSYSLTSHPELFFARGPKTRASQPGVPCMLYAVTQGAPVVLVHAHSNGCDIGDMRQTLKSISESLRVHVISFEFPGYGLYTGVPSMRSIDEAASTVLHFLVHEARVDPTRVVWYGRSIGSGPAVRMSHIVTKEMAVRPGGLILQCGFANFPEVAGHLFGRVAKRLVGPLWQNERMLKELNCPVLLIHGRNDTMIPISQSERLWDAVALRELSNFHTCDCGHNDFNFRVCTLRPIYDFLLSIISSPDFPSNNFTIEVPAIHRAAVHQIGPLRGKIPVYSFRRPELEEWMRELQGGQGAEKAPAVEAGQQVLLRNVAGRPELAGREGIVVAPDQASGNWRVQLLDSGEQFLVKPENLQALGTTEPAVDSAEQPQDKLEPRGREVATRGPPKAVDKDPASKDKEGSQKAVPPLPKQGKGKGKAEAAVEAPPPIPDYTEMPAVLDVNVALLEPIALVQTCALRIGSFLDRIQVLLDRVEGLEMKPIDEVVEFVEAEFWACDPLLGLWEEVQLPLGDRVRTRLGPFTVDNNGQRGYEPELGGSGPSGSSTLRVPLWVFCPSVPHFRCLAEWSLLHSQRLERSLPASSGSGEASGCCCVPCHRLTSKRRSRFGSTHPTRGVLASSLAAHFVHWLEKNGELKAMFSRFVRLHQNTEAFPETGSEPWAFSCSSRLLLREGLGMPSDGLSNYYSKLWGSSGYVAAAGSTREADSPDEAPLPEGKNRDLAVANALQAYRAALGSSAPVSPHAKAPPEQGGDPMRPEVRQLASEVSRTMKIFAQAEHRERREHLRHWLKPSPRIVQPSSVLPDSDLATPEPPMKSREAPSKSASAELASAEPEPEAEAARATTVVSLGVSTG